MVTFMAGGVVHQGIPGVTDVFQSGARYSWQQICGMRAALEFLNPGFNALRNNALSWVYLASLSGCKGFSDGCGCMQRYLAGPRRRFLLAATIRVTWLFLISSLRMGGPSGPGAGGDAAGEGVPSRGLRRCSFIRWWRACYCRSPLVERQTPQFAAGVGGGHR